MSLQRPIFISSITYKSITMFTTLLHIELNLHGSLRQMPSVINGRKTTLKDVSGQGGFAFRSGFPIDKNPYLYSSSNYNAWAKGWRQEKKYAEWEAERKKASI